MKGPIVLFKLVVQMQKLPQMSLILIGSYLKYVFFLITRKAERGCHYMCVNQTAAHTKAAQCD